MPWHISKDAYGCKGYAVVKDGTTEVEGCHKTRAAAERQMAALYASENKTEKMLAHYEMLSDAEKEYHDALVDIAEKYGKFDESGEGIWAGYEPAVRNVDAAIGVKCSNCSFFIGEGQCQIINAAIEPEGKCRLAAIPPGLVNSQEGETYMPRQKTMNTFRWDGKILKRSQKKDD